MQFFQCGIPYSDKSRYFPLPITCGTTIPSPEAISHVAERRDDDDISEYNSIISQNSKSLVVYKDRFPENNLKSARTLDSLDAFLSPFEEDLALDRNAKYAQHEEDIDAKVREILDYKAQTTSIKASVEKAAQRFTSLSSPVTSTRSGRKTRSSQHTTGLSQIVEELEAMSKPNQESPHMRIFCKLQQSERFKVFCFPRRAKSLVQLLRGVEEKLMYGFQGDRPGRLLLIVNNRASFSDDFVEIDDIASIRDEDRFIFIPFVAEEKFACDDMYERLDLNYSDSEAVSPRSETHPDFEHIGYKSIQHCVAEYKFSKSYPNDRQLSPSKLPRVQEDFEWLHDQILKGRTSTTSTGSSNTQMFGRVSNDELREYDESNMKASFDWSFDDNDLNESYQNYDQPVSHAGHTTFSVPTMTSDGREQGEEQREGPPADIFETPTSTQLRRQHANPTEAMEDEREFSPRKRFDFDADRYGEVPSDEIDSFEGDSFKYSKDVVEDERCAQRFTNKAV